MALGNAHALCAALDVPLQVLSSEFWPKDLIGHVEEKGAPALHPKLQQAADSFLEQVFTT
jgi:hypothetical protein